MNKDNLKGEHDIIVMQFDKQEIEKFDLMDIYGTLQGFLEDPLHYFNKIFLLISGYDDDPRDLWQIKEVRDFIFFLDNSFPYWFYFLKNDLPNDESPLLLFIPCLIPLGAAIRKNGKSYTEFDIKELSKIVEQHFFFFYKLADESNLEEERLITALDNIKSTIITNFLKQ